MEGTIHEKAVLVVIAYFIGFLTAYIAQTDVVSDYSEDIYTYIPVQHQTASVVNANRPVTPDTVATQPAVTANQEMVSYSDGVLSVSVLGATKVLSLNSEVSGVPVGDDFQVQGTHVGEVTYAVSPSQEFIFFCEQKTTDAKTCSPFIYDVLGDKIHSVTLSGDKIQLLNSAVKTVSWNNNLLQVENEVSKNPLRPWLLGF
jgi:hypothetical protein